MKMRSVAMALALMVINVTPQPAAATVTLPPGSITVPTSGSFLYLNSETGDFIGQGQERLFTTADSTIGGALRGSTFGAAVYLAAGGWGLSVAAPEGQPLVVGSYTGAARTPFRPAGSPGLEVGGESRLCNTVTGKFDVTELAFSSLGEITVFDAKFEQHCEGGVPALYGRIRVESAPPAPGSTLPPGSTTVPTAGTFLYLIKTNTSVGNNEQLYTAADASINWSLPYGSDLFHATVIQGNLVHHANVDIGAPRGTPLARGSYPNAVRATSRTTVTPGLDITADGHGCNEVSGSFEVDELTFAWNFELSVFQATFHFYCDVDLHLQHGRIRIENPTPPPPPPLVLGVSIREEGKVSKTGIATISGMVSCSRSVQFDLRGTLTQVKPDHTTLTGGIASSADCIAPSSTWSVAVGGSNKFGASAATATVDAIYCDGLGCVTATTTRTVKLNSGK